MKIGIVCYPTFGGSGVVATEVGMGLAKKGHQIHFITYKRPARLTHFDTNVFYHEVSGYDYPLFEFKPYDTALTSKLVDVILREELDIIHVHYAIPHATIGYIAQQIVATKGKHIPLVTTLHGTDITLVGQDRSFFPVVEFSINRSNAVTAVSQHLKDETFKHFNIDRDIKVIYNFIDFNRFKKIEKGHFRKAIAPNGEKILAHTSNFRKVKRIDDVIRAFDLIDRKVSSKLLLIGDGPERPLLEEMSRKLGLDEKILFLGKQGAVEELLAIADLFIIPSENESFGLAALEAMACEVPIISSNAGGIPEVNIQGVTGFLRPIGDFEGMAEDAIKLLQDPELIKQFSANAKERALTFNLDNILPQYEELYRSLLVAQ